MIRPAALLAVALALLPFAAEAGRGRGWEDNQAVARKPDAPSAAPSADCRAVAPSSEAGILTKEQQRRSLDRRQSADCLPPGKLPELRNATPN
jgi:hypothetical protein